MYHISCKLPNASTEINGIKFQMIKAGDGIDPVNHVRTIEPVDAETAKQFRGIEGYTIHDAKPADPPKEPVTGAQEAAKRGPGRPSKAELAARAAAAQSPEPPEAETKPAAADDDDDAPPSADDATAAALSAALGGAPAAEDESADEAGKDSTAQGVF